MGGRRWSQNLYEIFYVPQFSFFKTNLPKKGISGRKEKAWT